MKADITVSTSLPAPQVLAIDTGSAYTWVGAREHNPYVEGFASRPTGVTTEAVYASGSVTFKGKTYDDSIGLGALIIHSQGIGVPTELTNFPAGIDGILGLGPTRLTTGIGLDGKLIPTVVDNLYSQGDVSSPLVGVFFVPDNVGGGGLLSFGYIHATVITSNVGYAPVTAAFPAKYFWGVDAAIVYGDDILILDFGSGILDTASPRITFVTDAFMAYTQATGATLDTDGVLSITQHQYNNLQTLYIHIGEQIYYLSPNAQIYARPLPDSQIELVVESRGSDPGIAFSLGIPFFQRYYVVFDSSNNQVGIASHIHTDSTTN
ncbi:hypothetical protein ID866_11480 [Astraeus odoratus]|nr:hypothetical protein ID866_11480 [Astraeus odoratus]